MLLRHVVGLEHRPGEHEFPVQRHALAFEHAHVDGGRVVDQCHLALRRHQFGNGRPMVVGLVQRGHVGHRWQAQAGDFLVQRFAVVDHVVGAQFLYPLCRVLARSGADHGQARQLARQLHQDGTDAAGRADHQQGFADDTLVTAHLQALEQQFPCSDRSQWQRGRLGEIERARLVADDALVHQVQLAVGAGAGEVAGVPHFVAGLEHGDAGAYCLHHAGRIPADDLGGAIGRRHVGADFDIHRVDRNGLDRYQQVAALRMRGGQVDIDQCVVVGDGQGLAVGNGFHGNSVEVKCMYDHLFRGREKEPFD